MIRWKREEASILVLSTEWNVGVEKNLTRDWSEVDLDLETFDGIIQIFRNTPSSVRQSLSANIQIPFFTFCFLPLFHPHCIPSTRIIIFAPIFGAFVGITNNPLYCKCVITVYLNLSMFINFANTKNCHRVLFFFFGTFLKILIYNPFFYIDSISFHFFMMM